MRTLILIPAIAAMFVSAASCNNASQKTSDATPTDSAAPKLDAPSDDVDTEAASTPEETSTTSDDMPGDYSDDAIVGAYTGIMRNAEDIVTPASMSLDFDCDGVAEDIVIRFSQIPEVIAIRGSYGRSLLPDMDISFTDASYLINEYGDLQPDASIHAAAYDFGNDGRYELIVMLASPVGSYATIYTLSDIADTVFEPVGTIWTQSRIILEGDRIVAPYGSQGLFEEYLCDGRTLLPTDE